MNAEQRVGSPIYRHPDCSLIEVGESESFLFVCSSADTDHVCIYSHYLLWFLIVSLDFSKASCSLQILVVNTTFLNSGGAGTRMQSR